MRIGENRVQKCEMLSMKILKSPCAWQNSMMMVKSSATMHQIMMSQHTLSPYRKNCSMLPKVATIT